jgi:hypothetical protein
MATRPLVPAGIEIVIYAKQEGTERLNVIHASANGNTPTAEELQTAAETVGNQIASNLSAWHSSVVFDKVVATDISQPEGPSYVFPIPTPNTGTAAGDAMPANAALVVSINSTHGGRSGHGRIYHFGLPSTLTGGGSFVSNGYRNLVQTTWHTISTVMTSAGLPLCVFSRKNLALYPWQGESVDTTIDSQRRRLPGRGR